MRSALNPFPDTIMFNKLFGKHGDGRYTSDVLTGTSLPEDMSINDKLRELLSHLQIPHQTAQSFQTKLTCGEFIHKFKHTRESTSSSP